jgi:oligopeptide transport system permease protein
MIRARILSAIQVSVIVSVVVVGALDIFFGVFFGVLSGYFGGIVDFLLARFTDLMFAFPGLLLAILMAALLGPRFDLWFGGTGRLILVSLALGMTIWPQMARYVRGQTLQLKERSFVEAARTVGSSPRQIIVRHIIPNITNLIIVAVTLDMTGVIVGEGALSLLGLGVQPPNASIGLMIVQSNGYLAYYPFEELLPIFALILIVLGLSFIGDGLRDAFDPRG